VRTSKARQTVSIAVSSNRREWWKPKRDVGSEKPVFRLAEKGTHDLSQFACLVLEGRRFDCGANLIHTFEIREYRRVFESPIPLISVAVSPSPGVQSEEAAKGRSRHL
jgi:hypothetical protein